MNILQKIFTDHYEEIKYTLHPRKTEIENIDKMINCGDSSFGGAMYGCPHCGKLKFVPVSYTHLSKEECPLLLLNFLCSSFVMVGQCTYTGTFQPYAS